MTRNTPTKFDDVIDSRDVIERIENLRRALPDTAEEVMPGTSDELEDIGEELEALEALAEEAERYVPDWEYGATLIRESYFTDYCEELLKDCGELPRELPHYIVIDWEKTADNLRVDYTEVDFGGVTYLVR